MMTESFLRRTWDVPRPPSDQAQVPEPKRKWYKAWRPSTPAAPAGAMASQAPASLFLQAYPIVIVVLVVAGLFALGAVIAIALIPIYLANRPAEVSRVYTNTKNQTFELPVDQSLPVGPLSDTELEKLLTTLKANLPASVLQNSNLKIIGAEIVLVPNTRRRNVRQDEFKKVLRLIIELAARIQAAITALENAVSNAVTSSETVAVLQAAVVSVIEIRPSTVSSTAVSTVPATSASTTLSTTLSSSTVPPNLVSTVAPGRRRREVHKRTATDRPMVTYQD